jgi:redox-sensitive bicupin YhaK (pirin superfamily)
MEIISYVLEGGLEHKDSMGTGSVIRPGDVQRMSAGTGVRHSEYNASNSELVHFLQIWLLPEQRNLQPSYEQKTFAEDEKRQKLRLVGSRDGRDGSVTIHQDVDLYATRLEAGESVRHELKPGRHAWVHVARGKAKVNGNELDAGGAAALSGEARVDVEGLSGAEVLLFDLS